MDSIKRVRQFVKHWYTRYLVSTELYMVEPWEKAVIHIVFAVFFVCFWYFNCSIIKNGVSMLRSSSHEEM